jgi:alanyl-tRNA synthetase
MEWFREWNSPGLSWQKGSGTEGPCDEIFYAAGWRLSGVPGFDR